MDIINSVESDMPNRHWFILVDIDYFTKWVEAYKYRSVSKKVVIIFFWNNIICQFGVLELIIINNRANSIATWCMRYVTSFVLLTVIPPLTVLRWIVLLRPPVRTSNKYCRIWLIPTRIDVIIWHFPFLSIAPLLGLLLEQGHIFWFMK